MYDLVWYVLIHLEKLWYTLGKKAPLRCQSTSSLRTLSLLPLTNSLCKTVIRVWKKPPGTTEVWAMPAFETRWSRSCPQWLLTADLASLEAASRPASRGKFVDGLAPSTSTVNRKVEKLEVRKVRCFLSMLQPKQKITFVDMRVYMEVWWCMHISS